MYGITLTDRDRKVIRAYLDRDENSPAWENPLESHHELDVTVRYLDSVGLVKAAYGSGGVVLDYMLTDFGYKFILENPNLESEPDSRQRWEAQEMHNLRTEPHYTALERQAQESAKHNMRTLCIAAAATAISLASLLVSILSR